MKELFTTMKQDVRNMMDQKILLQKQLAVAACTAAAARSRKEENGAEGKALQEALQTIKTLKFENEIALSEMSEQRNHFDEELEELVCPSQCSLLLTMYGVHIV